MISIYLCCGDTYNAIFLNAAAKMAMIKTQFQVIDSNAIAQ